MNDYSQLTETILGSCFDVMNELGSGFLESVYKNALYIVAQERNLKVETEKRFDVMFHERKIGLYIADLVFEDSVIVELKCCDQLRPEHSAQLINYLKASGVMVGLLLNFGNKKLEYKQLRHPDYHNALQQSF